MVASRRFYDVSYLESWRADRSYPVIHSAITQLALQHLDPKGVTCDLCCSTGLLAQRLYDEGFTVFGLDGSVGAIANGHAYGIQVELVHHRIHVDRLTELLTLLTARNTMQLLARRCFPELFGGDLHRGREFAQRCHEAGITRIILQGRAKTAAPVNPLYSAEREVELLSARYQPVVTSGEVVYLEAM